MNCTTEWIRSAVGCINSGRDFSGDENVIIFIVYKVIISGMEFTVMNDNIDLNLPK